MLYTSQWGVSSSSNTPLGVSIIRTRPTMPRTIDIIVGIETAILLTMSTNHPLEDPFPASIRDSGAQD